MTEDDLVLRNPLRSLGYEEDNLLPEGGFGAVLARAGVGKTALLVQLALNALYRCENVLHVSLDDPVSKVALWYQEVYHNLTNGHSTGEAERLWQSLLPHRFIMNFRPEGFTVPVLEGRISELTSQEIFVPQMVVIDGLTFDDSVDEVLSQLKSLALSHAMNVWFTVRTHRHEEPEPDGMPAHLSRVSDLFDIIFRLQPEDKQIYVKALKGGPETPEQSALILDPSTMLTKEQ